jgi:uncharacterized membrane protein YkoI
LLSAALVGAVAPTTSAWANDEGNENENGTEVSLDQIPLAARAALLQEAAGATMLDVVQEMKHDQTVYEAHVRKGNDTIGIMVDATGKVLEIENETREPERP